MYWREVIPSFGGLGRAIGSGDDIVSKIYIIIMKVIAVVVYCIFGLG